MGKESVLFVVGAERIPYFLTWESACSWVVCFSDFDPFFFKHLASECTCFEVFFAMVVVM